MLSNIHSLPRRLLFLLAFFLLPGVSIATTQQEPRASHQGQLHHLPVPPYAASGINTGIFRRHALLTIGSSQLIAYFGQDGKVVLLRRNLSNGRVERTLQWDSQMSPQMLGDGHQAINMGFSSDGYVHLIWGCHDTPTPAYLKLRWPELVRVGGALPWGGFASRLSYPQFYGPPSRLLLSFRRDSNPPDHNQYDHCLIRYAARPGQWQALQTPLLTFPPAPQLAYLNNMGESGDALVVAYTIRRYDLMDTKDPHMRVMNDSLRLILSGDHGTSWRDLAGRQLPPPRPALDVPPLLRIDPNQNLINQGGGWLDQQRVYHFAYFKDDDAGVPQIFLTSVQLATGRLTTQMLTHRHESFDLLGRGTQTWPISRPAVFELGSTLMITYRDGDRLMAAFRPNSRPQFPWKVTELYGGQLGNYEPVLDYTALAQGRLVFYLQPSWQGMDDRPYDNPIAAEAWLLELAESTLQTLRAESLPPSTSSQ